jgi:hypothetical protein
MMFGLPCAVGLLVLACLVGLATRRLQPAGTMAAIGLVTVLACYAVARWGDEFLMRAFLGAEDWTRLQRELQVREADLAHYGRAHAGLTTSQLVKGYLSTHRPLPQFHFTDPRVPPLDFKISDWRDAVPRVVVGFGCDNNVLFNSATMAVEQSD